VYIFHILLPVWYILIQSLQTTMHPECSSTHCHDDEKMQSSLDTCYCSHIQFVQVLGGVLCR